MRNRNRPLVRFLSHFHHLVSVIISFLPFLTPGHSFHFFCQAEGRKKDMTEPGFLYFPIFYFISNFPKDIKENQEIKKGKQNPGHVFSQHTFSVSSFLRRRKGQKSMGWERLVRDYDTFISISVFLGRQPRITEDNEGVIPNDQSLEISLLAQRLVSVSLFLQEFGIFFILREKYKSPNSYRKIRDTKNPGTFP